jgi:prephenate dehydrogenase
MTLGRAVIVGAGLIGASVGLALRESGIEVLLTDVDGGRLNLAADLGAGTPVGPTGLGPDTGADLALICTPPKAVAHELMRLQKLDVAAVYSDVCSIKTRPQEQAEALGADMKRYVGGHPVAGRERSGPGNARADLFLGRPWVLTPSAQTSPECVATTEELVRACGAEPMRLSAHRHDEVMALVSHLPQALASVLAAQLTGAEPATARLAGQGFRDLTRIADSDPALWAQIAAGNAGPLADALRDVTRTLEQVAQRMSLGESAASAAFAELIRSGNEGRAALPGKHGATRQLFTAVPVVISDQPGALARLLADAGAADVNVEDLSLEHSPGAPVGLCELLVAPESAERLSDVLRERGWTVHTTAT